MRLKIRLTHHPNEHIRKASMQRLDGTVTHIDHEPLSQITQQLVVDLPVSEQDKIDLILPVAARQPIT